MQSQHANLLSPDRICVNAYSPRFRREIESVAYREQAEALATARRAIRQLLLRLIGMWPSAADIAPRPRSLLA